MTPLNVLVFYGSTRPARQGIKAAKFAMKFCQERGHTATLVDPMERKLPLLDKMYREYPKGEAPAVLEQLAGEIKAADAFLMVSGEYNHSIPPALSNTLDFFLPEYGWRPSGIMCYSAGPFGGVRAAMQLRAMLCELGMPSIPSLMPIPKVQDAFDDDGEPSDPQFRSKSAKFFGELEWYAQALKVARAGGVPY